MNTNNIVPRIGLGTYNMNSLEAEEVSYAAIEYGYRHIDTAAVYRNEDGVGRALSQLDDKYYKKALINLSLIQD